VEVSYRDDVKPILSGLVVHLYSVFVLEEVGCIFILFNSTLAANLCPINYISGYWRF
jgi:hypothetical protein